MGVRGVAVLAVLSCVAATPARAQIGFDLMRPPTSTREVRVSDRLPLWVALPTSARILGSRGVEVQPVRNSGVTLENTKLGFLVGALRNTGSCLNDVSLRLQYTNDRWAPIGPKLENEARVSRVEPDGLIPYRFRLANRSEFTEQPSGYILEVTEGDAPVGKTLEWVEKGTVGARTPCEPTSLRIEGVVDKARASLEGHRVDGEIHVIAGGPVSADGITVTVVLLDEDGHVLDVMTGIPSPKVGKATVDAFTDGMRARFEIRSPVPLGKAVRQRDVFIEVLPGARVDPAR
ncbi:MAG: hypothetical protein IT182_05070 [Acidobacteria bacterium]|nr:hypothetical protein [Acidobacteriota bacterium]